MNFTQTCSSSDGCQEGNAGAGGSTGTGGPVIVPSLDELAFELVAVPVEPDELEDT